MVFAPDTSAHNGKSWLFFRDMTHTIIVAPIKALQLRLWMSQRDHLQGAMPRLPTI
jgi:hypothetical protein